jgi:hypothetical protein
MVCIKSPYFFYLTSLAAKKIFAAKVGIQKYYGSFFCANETLKSPFEIN